MRNVIVGAFVSLDGVMQAPGGPQEDPTGGFHYGGWVMPLIDEVFGEEVDRLFNQPFDLLLGRKTYEIFAAHWPYAEGGADDGVAKAFNSTTKYVATRKGLELTWTGSVALRDAALDVTRLKREDGPALVTQGSTDLIRTLLASDLVDEIRMFTFPVVLGGGKKLFDNGARAAAFKLASHRVSPNGIVMAQYVRDGAVKTEDYAMDPPTPAEVARREKMQREG
ncbi:dihydrofolate reductase family protein [Halomonas eurihalina]|uniref:Dihydrofolate reductase family protein n=1 Tax=Halomonas eurihalina TaxID=42566 RepID=A0A5D9DCT4_HALER|nr:dihydrofolate reductase family protein [Halomonas eurihalina]MDR5858175.1 dihydrofolate reductase family protein [Halomonas eurihalina]TZG41323.1 dihydrofolate reductase family protein [Halomonas eurihalina]